MAAREKKPPAAESPRLTQSGRVVKSRLPQDDQPAPAQQQQQPEAKKKAQQQPPTVVGSKVARRRGRPLKRKPEGAAAKKGTKKDEEAKAGEESKPEDAPSAPTAKAAPKPPLKAAALLVGARAKMRARRLGSKAKQTAPKVKQEKEPEPEKTTAAAPVAPVVPSAPVAVEVKKEPESAESPLAAFDSRSPSPRNPRKRRTSSDLLLVMNQQQDGLILETKGPYSTRSERSNTPVPAAKPLRNGKQRSLKDALLTEAVEQEIKKRKRGTSDSVEQKTPSTSVEPEEENKKPKRRRSESKDGGDTTEVVTVEEEPSQAISAEDHADETESPKAIVNETIITEPDVEMADSTETSPGKVSGEKITEKTLILDNMSKAFNDAAVGDKTKNIRRSARQRKSTAKAKERDSSTAEKDADAKSTTETVKSDEADASDMSSIVEDKTVVNSDIPIFDGLDSKVDGRLEDAAIENEESVDKIDDSLKENIENPYAKSYTHQDLDKLIDRLKCLEEQDRKRQEEISKLNSRSVMVTTDVVLIPKSNVEDKALKDLPNSAVLEKTKEKENALNCLESNSSISIVKKEQIRRSFDIDLPSSVTLIKRSVSRKRSSGSNSKDSDSVTMIDKSLGKEIMLDIRKSIDKGILTIEPSKPEQPPPKLLKSSNGDALTNDSDINFESDFTLPIDETTLRRNSLEIISIPSSASALAKMRPSILDGVQGDVVTETPEKQREKEEVLKTLGLLTLEAANQAKIDKQKQKELIKTTKAYSTGEGYTGTLKTVIKLNRASPEKKKGRSPLKMTFQKSKNRSSKFVDMSNDSESDESSFYTIHKEVKFGGSSGSGTGSSDNHMTSGGHRKTHYSNRFNHESGPQDNVKDIMAETPSSKEATGSLVIPEKASSFGIHPGRLCQDQCFYCGGKFGLFDTPCHIAQIKSSDRQKKILDNEEKLTIDSCLCDACYRHVDRRANCPSYRKRAGGPGSLPLLAPNAGIGDMCYVNSCGLPAPHTLRRKWLVKMRRNISKVVQLDLDYPGQHTILLCDMHYQIITQLMVCSLCKRRLSRNHVHYVNQDKVLNPLLQKQGIPVVFEEKPVVCKSCRYFCTLLLRPPSPSEPNKLGFLKSHHRRLIQAHNVTLPDESDTDFTDEHSTAQDLNDQKDISKDKKRGKVVKSKSKKSIDHKLSDENSLTQTRNNNSKGNSLVITAKNMPHTVMLEDMESLISSNKILVPGAGLNVTCQSTGVSTMNINDSNVIEYDDPLISDAGKRAELHNSLKNWNMPSTTILQLNPKSRNILKVHNATASNKSQGQRKLNRNEKRIQKLGQIITHKNDFEEALSTKIPNRDEFTIEPMSVDERNSNQILRNIALNDECTIETIPPKTGKNSLDINSLKSKWVNTESFSQVKRNLNALSKNHNVEQMKKKGVNQPDYNFSNPVHRLETNPSISVRELFPGEEEMNLHCNIEFGNVKGITPEGWEKCNTTIQYDSDTKILWQELQRPYGNQSSFLRHLILLEKYFRNGDLILNQYANPNAVTYSESVQNRLRSYDNTPTNGDISASFMNKSALSINVTNTVTSDSETTKRADGNVGFRKPGTNASKSLLKHNQSVGPDANKSGKGLNKADAAVTPSNSKNSKGLSNMEKTPKDMTQQEKRGSQLTPIQTPTRPPRPPTPMPDLPEVLRTPSLPPATATDVKTSTPKTETIPNKSKATSLPPELIAINQSGQITKKNIENVIKSLKKGNATPPPPTTTALSSSFTAISPISASSQAKASKSTSTGVKEGGVKKKGKGSSKQWRPTLIPITDESTARNGRDILHQTADGRRLPSLVQVLSGGKPYYITIADYNRMCVMRREKLQQENLKKENQKKNQTASTPNTTDGSIDPSIVLAANQHNPPSPPATETDKSSTMCVKISETANSVQSNDKDGSDVPSTTPAEVEPPASMLKNVVITPISDSNKTITNNPQSLLITSAKSIMQVPSIISQLNSSISVTAEPAISSGGEVLAITSQGIVMPKIPKSLTVIPQTINNNPAATSPPAELSVLPLLPACTISPATTLTVSPSEP